MNKYRVVISTDPQQEIFNSVYEIPSTDPVLNTLLKPDSDLMKDLGLCHINYLDPNIKMDIYLESHIELEDHQTNIFNTIQKNLIHDMDFDPIIDIIFESLDYNGIKLNRNHGTIPEPLRKVIIEELESYLSS